MTINPIRIGIIGTNWGRMHVGGFRGAGAAITALCGHDLARTRDIAREEGIPVATDRVATLCEAVDAVVVSGPDSLHHEHIVAALDAGCHVLAEKPLTRTAADADDLAARARTLATAGGRVCAVSFAYRMIPPLAELHRWLRGRPPGQWLDVALRSSFAAAEGRAAEGPLMGASGDFGGASHVLDAAFWLMGGEPVWVEATMAGRPAHSLALHIGLSTGGVVAMTHLASHDPGIIGQWHLLGDSWEARFTGEYRPQHQGWRIGPAEVFAGHWREVGPRVAPAPGRVEPWAMAHQHTARAFLEAVAGGAAERLARFADGATVQRVLAAAMQSEQEHRRIWLEPAPAAPASGS